jgi:hypothetical protein
MKFTFCHFFLLHFCFLHFRFNITDISAEFRYAVIQPNSCAYNLQAMDFLRNPPISSDLFADHVFIILGLLNIKISLSTVHTVHHVYFLTFRIMEYIENKIK